MTAMNAVYEATTITITRELTQHCLHLPLMLVHNSPLQAQSHKVRSHFLGQKFGLCQKKVVHIVAFSTSCNKGHCISFYQVRTNYVS